MKWPGGGGQNNSRFVARERALYIKMKMWPRIKFYFRQLVGVYELMHIVPQAHQQTAVWLIVDCRVSKLSLLLIRQLCVKFVHNAAFFSIKYIYLMIV